jgi:hypothetical protein
LFIGGSWLVSALVVLALRQANLLGPLVLLLQASPCARLQ